MSQPKWKCVAQLGDANPVEYGGYWVFIDKTGVYPPEAELLEVPQEEDSEEPYTAYRFSLDPCTFVDGILSDNEFHPESPAWFADSLSSVARCCGVTRDSLIALFLSDVPADRAIAWRMVGEYHGPNNLDSYPLEMTRSEARRRYGKAMYRVKD